MKKPGIPDEILGELRRLHRDGWTLGQLVGYANAHGCDTKLWGVRRALIKAGEQMRGKAGRITGTTELRVGSLTIASAMELRDKGYSLAQIASKAGVTKQCVHQQLNNHARRVGE